MRSLNPPTFQFMVMAGDVALDVAAWLDSLGLGRCSEAFVANRIDKQALLGLTLDDLKRFGIDAQGDRIRLLQAIEALRAIEAERDRASMGASAERRHLTLMFADVVDSSGLSTRLDPEELRDVIARFHAVVAKEVGALDGFVAQLYGDGALSYFGWPTTHEDAAERAVEAALRTQVALATLAKSDPRAPKARIGIASGWVVVGSWSGQHGVAAGETPNLAARLQGLAEPGGVVISKYTAELLGDAFELVELGPQSFKGFPTPHTAFKVRGAAAKSRFEARSRKGLAPFVGRQRELDRLAEAWVRANAGEGQVVILSGEPGIGKSRTARMAADATGANMRLRYQCSAFHRNSSLHPLASQLEIAAGFSLSDDGKTRLAKLESSLSATGADEGFLNEVAELMALPVAKPSALSPQQRREKLFSGFLGQMEHLVANGPIIVVFEDLHWMDPTTADYLALAVKSMRQWPVLTLFTARPEFETPPAWRANAGIVRYELDRLADSEIREIALSVAGTSLSQQLIRQIVTKAEGVPLFGEELAKAIVEANVSHPVSMGEASSLAVPATLQDSLMARLGRSPSVMKVAQIGAAVGRSFPHELLASVAPISPAALTQALDELANAELIKRTGRGDITYVFKHALVQDAAYSTLLHSQRRTLHADIAEAIEAKFPHIADAQPEAIARHWTAASRPEKATSYWLRAGQRAASRFANVEAIEHLQHGVEALKTMPAESFDGQLDFNLHLGLGQACYVVYGPAAAETREAYQRALELIEAVDDPNKRYALIYGIFAGFHFASRFEDAEPSAQRVLAIATRDRDAAHLCQAHRMLGYLRFFQGRYPQALDHFRKLAKIYSPKLHGQVAFRYGADSRVSVHGFQCVIEAITTSPNRGVKLGRENLAYARSLGHPASLGWAFASLGYLYYFLRRPEEAESICDEGAQYCEENNVAVWGLHARVFRSWARAIVSRANLDEHAEDIRRTVADANARIALGQPLLRGCLSEVLLLRDRPQEALQVIDAAILGASGQRIFEPAVLALRARCQIATDGASRAAEATIVQAMQAAREMGATYLELRAAHLLAQIAGREAEARRRVAKLLRHIDGAADLEDLAAAKALVRRTDIASDRSFWSFVFGEPGRRETKH